MRGSKINLLVSNENYRKLEKLFTRLRIFTIFSSILLPVVILIYFVSNFNLVKEISSLQLQKTGYLSQIKSKNQDEANLIYLSKKTTIINKYLAENTEFIPYYNTLLGSVKKIATSSAALTKFSIDKSRVTSFGLTFASSDEMISFLKFSETDGFLDNFERLTVNKIALGNNTSLDFEGKFKKLNEPKN